jgi:hypothetical protein
MKKRYVLAAMIALFLSIQFPIRAEIPAPIKSCLAPNPLHTTPKQYREFARVSDGRATYYYLHAIYRPSEIPSSQVLIKVEGTKCVSLGQPVLNPIQDISRFVPSRVAAALAEAKWRSFLKMKGGRDLIRDILNPKPFKNEMGENLSPANLSQLDRNALRKIGFTR